MNVLIIDDSAVSLPILRSVLTHLDASLLLYDFSDPLEALAWASRFRADFVLLDYLMPGIDGLEFARRFRLDPKHLDIPILMVTTDNSPGVRAAALALGILDVVVKPFRPAELEARCRNVMNLRMHTEKKRQDLSQQHRSLAAWIQEHMKDDGAKQFS